MFIGQLLINLKSGSFFNILIFFIELNSIKNITMMEKLPDHFKKILVSDTAGSTLVNPLLLDASQPGRRLPNRFIQLSIKIEPTIIFFKFLIKNTDEVYILCHCPNSPRQMTMMIMFTDIILLGTKINICQFVSFVALMV